MPYYVNSVTLGGYLVGPPEIRHTSNGHPVANFLVALNRPGKDIPDYITCVAWKEKATALQTYARKGQEISITGELETNAWVDRNGSKHTTTKVVVEKFCLGSLPRSAEMTVRRPPPPRMPDHGVEE